MNNLVHELTMLFIKENFRKGETPEQLAKYYEETKARIDKVLEASKEAEYEELRQRSGW